MLTQDVMLKDIEITEEVSSQFQTIAAQYINAVIDNINNCFPQVHTLTLLGYIDPRNVSKATPVVINELGKLLAVDNRKLWQEFLAYRSFAKKLISRLKQLFKPFLIQLIKTC